jgi:putative transposase
LKTAASRHNAYYGAKKLELDPERHPERCEEVARQMIDISHFMAVFQQRFACYINRVHNRRGRLWSNRFKSTILEGGSALWNCVKYIELNPVRAGIVENPADYRFCTWGRFCGSGKHAFAANFHKHMKTGMATVQMNEFSFEAVCTLFRAEIARTIVSERAESSEADIRDAMDKAKCGDSMPVKFLRRTRHWADGAIIGSKAFVQEAACQFEDKERVLKKTLSRGKTPDGIALHCFRRLTT